MGRHDRGRCAIEESPAESVGDLPPPRSRERRQARRTRVVSPLIRALLNRQEYRHSSRRPVTALHFAQHHYYVDVIARHENRIYPGLTWNHRVARQHERAGDARAPHPFRCLIEPSCVCASRTKASGSGCFRYRQRRRCPAHQPQCRPVREAGRHQTGHWFPTIRARRRSGRA
jgi:hypothetical protein